MEHVAHVQDAVEEEQHAEPLIQLLREAQVCLWEVMGEAKAVVEVEKFEGEQHAEPLIQPLREVQVCLGEVMGEAKAIVEVEKFELLWYEVGAAVVEHIGPI